MHDAQACTPAGVPIDADPFRCEEPAGGLQRGTLHRVAEQLAVHEHELLTPRQHEARLLGYLRSRDQSALHRGGGNGGGAVSGGGGTRHPSDTEYGHLVGGESTGLVEATEVQPAREGNAEGFGAVDAHAVQSEQRVVDGEAQLHW